jgi:hypothetical protein
LNEFTNLLNVFRNNDIDIPTSLKVAIAKRVRTVFSQKEFFNEVRELSFEQVSKIFSDLIHHSSVVPVALRLVQALPDKRSQKQDETVSSDTMLRNLGAVMRVIDAIGNNPEQVESLDFLIIRLEKYLRQEENFNLLNINQCTRILKAFAFAAHTNVMRFPMLDTLVRKIQQNIDTLRENDVISILKSYVYISSDVKFS